MPTTFDQLLGALQDHIDHRLIGGGTQVIPMRTRTFENTPAICLRTVDALSWVSSTGCGATVPMSTLATNPEVPLALRQAANLLGTPNVRRMATVGGNVALGEPGCVAVVLLALNAHAYVLHHDGTTRYTPVHTIVGRSAGTITAFNWSPPRSSSFTKMGTFTGGEVLASVAIVEHPSDSDETTFSVAATTPRGPELLNRGGQLLTACDSFREVDLRAAIASDMDLEDASFQTSLTSTLIRRCFGPR